MTAISTWETVSLFTPFPWESIVLLLTCHRPQSTKTALLESQKSWPTFEICSIASPLSTSMRLRRPISSHQHGHCYVNAPQTDNSFLIALQILPFRSVRASRNNKSLNFYSPSPLLEQDCICILGLTKARLFRIVFCSMLTPVDMKLKRSISVRWRRRDVSCHENK